MQTGIIFRFEQGALQSTVSPVAHEARLREPRGARSAPWGEWWTEGRPWRVVVKIMTVVTQFRKLKSENLTWISRQSAVESVAFPLSVAWTGRMCSVMTGQPWCERLRCPTADLGCRPWACLRFLKTQLLENKSPAKFLKTPYKGGFSESKQNPLDFPRLLRIWPETT